ncbi:MAG: Fe-S cluster assembly protein SufD [Gallionellales bacterium 35-53-114]|nr:MAG: Fe-S cluster assembly protein SufD [Gallionellales bacterium 35-53-114]OYZ64160.1 MAG: Fe-S cluster assembly protein SufD [Gallionellales bacterium 24-53-125]OZB10531.1 MAG: Fe-S cluster assembly protein SufD [Gallionellales bacterium 39-52-133]
MSAVIQSGSIYLHSLLAGQPGVATSKQAWLNKLRSSAVESVSELTIPTTRDEEWRFTDLTMLTKVSLQPAQTSVKLSAADIQRFHIKEAENCLVFVDGVYAAHLSKIDNSLIILNNLSSLVDSQAALLQAHLAQQVASAGNVFAALNTAQLRDAAVIMLPRDTQAKAPVHLLFIATQKEVVSYPRTLLLADNGCEATVIEDYVSLQDETYFTNAVTEFVLADNARIHHVRVQREGVKAFHIANCAATLSRGSNYQSVNIAMGARISRYNLNVKLAEGAECSADGLAMISGRQLADTHTCIDHAQPHAISRQLHKCIVGGGAHAVFNGKIMVRRGAHHTDSEQSNHTLLLTDKAHIDTKPQLEIFNDDVKCTHGATIGQLDKDEVFYLQSRGVTHEHARNMLTYAFGAEVIERIPVASLKHSLEQTVLEQTSAKI